MRNSGDAAKIRMADDLAAAYDLGKVRFYKAQTPISSAGQAQSTVLTEFLI